MAAISGKQKRYLRALAHKLDPLVLIGQRGLTEAVVRQVSSALDDHELIKAKLAPACPLDRAEVAASLAAQAGCNVAGIIGRTLILYRARADAPSIRLPDSPGVPMRSGGPRREHEA